MSQFCLPDLNEGVEGLLLVVLGDDLRQQHILALSQLDEGTDAVDVRVDLDIQDIILSWVEKLSQPANQPIQHQTWSLWLKLKVNLCVLTATGFKENTKC